jgi:hypothetical protein
VVKHLARLTTTQPAKEVRIMAASDFTGETLSDDERKLLLTYREAPPREQAALRLFFSVYEKRLHQPVNNVIQLQQRTHVPKRRRIKRRAPIINMPRRLSLLKMLDAHDERLRREHALTDD